MGVVTKADVVSVANALLKGPCNSGISWGSNSFPANSLAGWFGGTTAGVTSPPPQPGSSSPVASDVVGTLVSYAAKFAAIRKVQITIYQSMNGLYPKKGNTNNHKAWLMTLFNGSGVAFTSSPAGAPSVGSTTLQANTLLTLSSVNDVCSKLYSSYVANSRNTTLFLTNTICHYNCHSNCHDSRHRR